jgi:chorismate mutase
MADERLEDLRARLDAIAEEIADLGHARLKEAIRTGSAKATADERRLSRARRSVMKAAVLLGGGDDADDGDGP